MARTWITKVNNVDTVDAAHVNDLQTYKLDKDALPYIRPEDYGAVGDGVHDDTAAIQAAITVGNTIALWSSAYKITGTITIPANRTIYLGHTNITHVGASVGFKVEGGNVRVFGSGQGGQNTADQLFGSVIIHASAVGGNAVFQIGDYGDSFENVIFRDFRIKGDANTGDMFQVRTQYRFFNWENLLLGNYHNLATYTQGAGINLCGTTNSGVGDYSRIERCTFTWMLQGIIVRTANFTNCIVSQNGFENIRYTGIDISQSADNSKIQYNTFFACCQEDDPTLDANVRNAAIRLCPRYAILGYIFDMVIEGNTFQYNGLASAETIDVFANGIQPGVGYSLIFKLSIINNVFNDDPAPGGGYVGADTAIAISNVYNCLVMSNHSYRPGSVEGAYYIPATAINTTYLNNLCTPANMEFKDSVGIGFHQGVSGLWLKGPTATERAVATTDFDLRYRTSSGEGPAGAWLVGAGTGNNLVLYPSVAGSTEKVVIAFWDGGSVRSALEIAQTVKQLLLMKSGGNVGIGQAVFGTSADRVLAVGLSAGVPTSSPADSFQMYCDDVSGVGTCAPQFRTENGGVVKLFTAAAQADLKADYTTLDLDTEAEIIAAINATNAGFNTLLAKLRTHGLIDT